MRLNFVAVFVLIVLVAVINAESASQTNFKASDSNPKIVNGNDFHQVTLRGSRKLTEEGEVLVDSEERGLGTSAKNLLSRLTGKFNLKNVAGAKPKKLSKAQIETVSKDVVKEVKKNPGAWPVIKTGLKILFGTAMFALIAAGIYTVVHQARNYS
ncbi:RxLR effector protein [Phytophthora megakarya]|uniref:RxLR effector protein n=1 Tax=Phytophthora megakarya TaxID=4795 RepID=A0A225UDU9_9STRA|nr:RxLR effector protein [Phytophthora megakarya]